MTEAMNNCNIESRAIVLSNWDGSHTAFFPREATPAPAQPAAYRWRFLSSPDKTWRYTATLPGFDPAIVECEPLFTA